MTDFIGTIIPGSLAILQSGLSTNLSGSDPSAVDVLAIVHRVFISGPSQVGTPNRVFSVDVTGMIVPSVGETLFDRVNVEPALKELGSVLERREWTIEVWNSHLREAKTLNSVSVTGVGGLTVTGRASGVFGPGESTTYDAVILKDGGLTIANKATWIFAGEDSIVSNVTGMRIQVFSPCMDWKERFEEGIEFRTTVVESPMDESEHRMQLRTVPRYTLKFRVLTPTNLDAVGLDALLYGWADQLYGVPVWPEKVRLGADVAAGSSTFLGDLTNMPSFFAGGLFMVWRNQQSFEAFTIKTKTNSQLTTEAPALRAWAADSWLVPLRRGRLAEEQSLGRPTNWLTADTFTFNCEALV